MRRDRKAGGFAITKDAGQFDKRGQLVVKRRPDLDKTVSSQSVNIDCLSLLVFVENPQGLPS